MHESVAEDLSWLPETEGQLSLDVLEDARHVYVRTAIAGVRPEELDINITHDTVTIRGTRMHVCETLKEATAHVEECYWGAFSRSVVLPHHVRAEEADATLRNGVLTITLPKAEMGTQLHIIESD